MKCMPLPQNYDPKQAESRWQSHWFASPVYHWHDDSPRDKTYVIDTPPPTVSGLLHMGHVFSYTQCDFIARYRRMKGDDVFYSMGFDDNGLPTERLVEKIKKKRATDYASREEFIAVCDEVAEEARIDFRALFKSIALSVDWRQEYHTISDEARKISQLSFLDMYEKGHVERRLQPFFWDPVDQTAIAQAEIVDTEMDSAWNDIWFGIEGSDEKILIGTTRPELIPACVAIFYHPEDERYQHLKGKSAVTPLFGVKVPILQDEAVEPEKGTGIMMCCTFGDDADIEKWRKHKLETRVVLNKYGKMDFTLVLAAGALPQSDSLAALANKKVSNKDAKHPGARETVIELLRESGDLKETKPIRHSVKCAERSGAPLEILPTNQWFVKVMDKKDVLKQRSAECNWHPEWMKVRMEQWIDGLNADWCISRQRYFGVPFPIWYSKRPGEEGKILIASTDQLPCNPLKDVPRGYSRDEVEPDMDVMDTWATSSISPQINAKGLVESDRYCKLFPADLRPQAHEIIRTWAFYTVVKSHLHAQTIPWKNLMISGWCLAEDKTKMSKSKGNVVTPIELIEEHGTDAVRYWAATSRLGQDTAFSKDLLKIGRKLVTKLFNATKFAALHLDKLEEDPPLPADDNALVSAFDGWMLGRLQRTIAKATEAFEHYEYADALRATDELFWKDFCDNYLELIKKRVYAAELDSHLHPVAVPASTPMAAMALLAEETEEARHTLQLQRSAVHTIYHCLQSILRLYAPFIPHITEELFSHIFPSDYNAAGSLHARRMWPDASLYIYDESMDKAGEFALTILEAIRKAKSERNLSIKFPVQTLSVTLSGDAPVSRAALEPFMADICAAGNIEHLLWPSHVPENAVASDDGTYSLSIEFGEAVAA